jgi:hypothetical protein
LVPTVPTFHDLTVCSLNDYDSGDRDVPPGLGQSEAVPKVRGFEDYTGNRFAAVYNRILDVYDEIGQSGSHVTYENFERVGTNYVIAFPQAVNDGLGGKKFVYRFFTSLIPDLIEPAVNNCVGICGHNSA